MCSVPTTVRRAATSRLLSACRRRAGARRLLRQPESRPCAGWEYEAGGACVAMPSTAFVQGVSVDALSVAEDDGFVWIRPREARQALPQPPGPRGTCALPPGYEVVAEVQVGSMHRVWQHCMLQTLSQRLLSYAHYPLTQSTGPYCAPSGPSSTTESVGQVDAEASAGLLVDALLAVDQGAVTPAALPGSHATGAAAMLLKLFAPVTQLVQSGEVEARVLAPGVVSTSTGTPPRCWDVQALCSSEAEFKSGLLQRDIV